MEEKKNRMKLAIVGDGAVGKTCLIMAYADNRFPDQYVPTVFDTYSMSITILNTKRTVEIFDTAGQEEYDRLRPLAYPGTNVFMVCFSVDQENSFNNIKQKWVPEVRHHVPAAKLIVVGTKTDKRQVSDRCISAKRGHKLQEEVGADCYMECSAKTRDGLSQLFSEAFLIHFHPPAAQNAGKKRHCRLL